MKTDYFLQFLQLGRRQKRNIWYSVHHSKFLTVTYFFKFKFFERNAGTEYIARLLLLFFNPCVSSNISILLDFGSLTFFCCGLMYKLLPRTQYLLRFHGTRSDCLALSLAFSIFMHHNKSIKNLYLCDLKIYCIKAKKFFRVEKFLFGKRSNEQI